jgi:hypothetical protein
LSQVQFAIQRALALTVRARADTRTIANGNKMAQDASRAREEVEKEDLLAT